MKVLFVTDLHGCKWKYERLLNAAKTFGAEVVINGGDLLPKSGDLFLQGEFITSYLDKHFEQFNSAGITYLNCLGNDDLNIYDKVFEETCNEYPYVFNLAQRKYELNGYEFVGMNWVVDYPFRLKDRCRMDTADYVFQEQFGTGILSTPNGFKDLDDWFAYANTLPTIEDEMTHLIKPDNMGKAVYVIHMPPYRLGLDKCSHGAEVGSKAIYNFLQQSQPLLSLHGHIHESPDVTEIWKAKLGNTVCIQPGQLNAFTYVIIDLEKMEMKRITEEIKPEN